MTSPTQPEEIECGCEDMDYQNHWAEDKYGNEYRVECGCPCPKCKEY